MEGMSDLSKAFAALGIEEGDALLVHSSLSSLGVRLEAGPNTVIEALLDCLGPSGTLCFPGLSYLNVTREQPVFDVRRTASNVGIVPEVFRREFASHRSLHPTHSVCCIGPLSHELTRRHHLDTTPCGKNSPFSLLPQMGGKLLMLGCSLRRNTTIHAVEESVGVPYVLGGNLEYTLVDWNGGSRRQVYRCHGFDGLEQWYERVVPSLPPQSYVKGKAFKAEAYVMDLKALWAAAVRLLEENPYALVGPI
jgi:aminoglycoside 3-N-acetyltransferase